MADRRNLVVALGDQLNRDSSAFDGFSREHDAVWMAEVPAESTIVWSHKARIALFLSAMRHFRDSLREEGITVGYSELDAQGPGPDLASRLVHSLRESRFEKVIVTEPGEYRVAELLQRAAAQAGVGLEIRTDRHFFSTREDFAKFAKGRKQLRMEYFYRELRRKFEVLLEDGEPAGGNWNFDRENRGSFGRQGPGKIPAPVAFPPDAVTREVLDLVERLFPDHPGSLANFDWPVTPAQARESLDDFVSNRLQDFGQYQDAMWTGETYLYHSRLSAALNLKLLDPRAVIRLAEDAWLSDQAPLPAVEGFIRQILGWREYIRGVYWAFMPGYLAENALDAHEELPGFFWTGDTGMACLRDTIRQTLDYGYAHHIQRLMVTGLYCLLLGVEPGQVHEWYLAIYVDAVEWVELPNVIGMSQFADGGRMSSKPYAASGKYIERMSNYCAQCQYNPAESTGGSACPFTTLYWDFLNRNRQVLARIPRMKLQLNNLDRLSSAERKAIASRAEAIRAGGGAPPDA